MSEENQPWIFDYDYTKPLEPNSSQRHLIISHWERNYIVNDPFYRGGAGITHSTSLSSNNIDSKPVYTVQLGKDIIDLIARYSFPVPIGLHCDCKLHFMTNIKHENAIKPKLKGNKINERVTADVLYKPGAMIYIDSLNPYIPIKLDAIVWNGSRQWRFMFQSFNSNLYCIMHARTITYHGQFFPHNFLPN